ncbi:MAG: tetratricopeptide repeat protein [Rhodanobacteraceae bacterium]
MFSHRVFLPMVLLFGVGVGMQVSAAPPVPSAASAPTPSLAVLKQQAATGDAKAEVALGQRLVKSKDPADKARAVALFRKAVAQGSTDAEWELGAAYFVGAGVTRDVPTGLDWMHKSLSDGSGIHMFEYGVMLQMAGGSQQETLKWIRKSAEAGSWPGMMFLAMAEQKKDPADARRWMLKAAQAGNPLPQMLLGWGYILGKGMFESPNVNVGLHWLLQAAQQGYAPAEGELGLLLITGEHHVSKNPVEGVQWAEKAAVQHNAYGYYALGYAYQLGNGEPVNPAKAWYNFAAAQRLDTNHDLDKVGENMSLVATELSPAQIQKLQTEVAQIPVPKKKAGRVNQDGNFNPGDKK